LGNLTLIPREIWGPQGLTLIGQILTREVWGLKRGGPKKGKNGFNFHSWGLEERDWAKGAPSPTRGFGNPKGDPRGNWGETQGGFPIWKGLGTICGMWGAKRKRPKEGKNLFLGLGRGKIFFPPSNLGNWGLDFWVELGFPWKRNWKGPGFQKGAFFGPNSNFLGGGWVGGGLKRFKLPKGGFKTKGIIFWRWIPRFWFPHFFLHNLQFFPFLGKELKVPWGHFPQGGLTFGLGRNWDPGQRVPPFGFLGGPLGGFLGPYLIWRGGGPLGGGSGGTFPRGV